MIAPRKLWESLRRMAHTVPSFDCRSAATGGQIADQDVPRQLPLRLYRDARFGAQLQDAG
jgi:hypothetical protein